MDAGNPPVDPRGMRYPRAMPSALGAGLARGMRGVSTSRADTGLAGGFVPTGPRVAKLDRAVMICALGCTSLANRRVVGRGDLWRWFVPASPAGLLSPSRGLCGWSRDTSAGGLSPPAYRQTCPGCAPLRLHAGGFVN